MKFVSRDEIKKPNVESEFPVNKMVYSWKIVFEFYFNEININVYVFGIIKIERDNVCGSRKYEMQNRFTHFSIDGFLLTRYVIHTVCKAVLCFILAWTLKHYCVQFLNKSQNLGGGGVALE